jgi:hypothetical protein
VRRVLEQFRPRSAAASPPPRKPEGRELLDWQKEFNAGVNKIRWMIEQVISHFKNWTVMHTGYRRPLNTFTTSISAVIGCISTGWAE